MCMHIVSRRPSHAATTDSCTMLSQQQEKPQDMHLETAESLTPLRHGEFRTQRSDFFSIMVRRRFVIVSCANKLQSM